MRCSCWTSGAMLQYAQAPCAYALECLNGLVCKRLLLRVFKAIQSFPCCMKNLAARRSACSLPYPTKSFSAFLSACRAQTFTSKSQSEQLISFRLQYHITSKAFDVAHRLMQVSGICHIFSCTESLWANITLSGARAGLCVPISPR
jgi:hypothetical protein